MTAEKGKRAKQSTWNRDIGDRPEHWAVRRALDLCGLSHQRRQAERAASGSRVLRAFVCYIEQNEEPPVDPLPDDRREVAASSYVVVDPLKGRLSTCRDFVERLMKRRLQFTLVVVGMAALAVAVVPHLRARLSTDVTTELCSRPLPSSLRMIDCNNDALVALVENTLETAEDNRMRAAVVVFRKPKVSSNPRNFKHYAIVDVDCATLSESDVLLVRTFDMSNVEQESPQFFEDFLDYWYSPEPARFHRIINQVVCERI